MKLVKDGITKVEQRTGISVKQYLNWGKKGTAQFGAIQKDGCYYFGEIDSQNNKPHGRGIWIDKYGWISIQRWKDGSSAPGNYIAIDYDGDFRIGEIISADGNGILKWRYT